jgi:hypothetical protein
MQSNMAMAYSQTGGMQNQEAPGHVLHRMQPSSGGMQNIHKQDFPPAGIQSNQHNFPHGGMQDLRNHPPGSIQTMQGMEFMAGAMHDMRNMQNLGMQDLQGTGRKEMPGMQMPQMQQGSNMQSPPMMQMIALPAGAAPPKGAIPIGPMHQAGSMPAPGGMSTHGNLPMPGSMPAAANMSSPGLPPSGMQEPIPHPNFQVIAVPMGEAPPEGAIPVEQFSSATPRPDPTWQSANREKKVFKIRDPRTGREVCGPGEEGARRRMRIINPKTGEEIRPNL